MNAGDTAYLLTCAAMVLFMTPGLAFFYGGLVRRKNVLSILMQCFIIMCVVGLQWVLFGYSLAFAPDAGGGVIGNLSWIGLAGVGAEPSAYAPTVPHLSFMIFQAMFAMITPALIIGALAERIKFSGFIIFTLLWATLVYDPIAHWVWGDGGWLKSYGALDFAGGVVVHASSGITALVMALLLGRRSGYNKEAFPPHNLPFTVLGGGLLWFGWFGFNAGSALAANGLAAIAFVNTYIAAVTAGLMWALLEWRINGSPTMLGTVTGIVAGLAGVTPACGYIVPLSAIPIGLVASGFCFIAVTQIKPRLGFDDSLDAFGVHAVSGIWGTLATGLFAAHFINPAGADGAFYGNAHQFLVQAVLVFVPVIYAAVLTVVLFKLVEYTFGMRVKKEEESMGLDLSQHKEAAYTMLD